MQCFDKGFILTLIKFYAKLFVLFKMVYSASTSKVSSVQSTSKSGSSVGLESKLDEALKHIIKSNKVVAAISQKKNIIGHTAVAFIFEKQNETDLNVETDTEELIKNEENSIFTFDYGAENNAKSKAALKSSIPGNVGVNMCDVSTIDVKLNIAEFLLKTDNQKSLIKKLFKVLIGINMGDYDLLENNCRDYVVAAYAIIIEFIAQMHNDKIDWKIIKAAAKKGRDLLENSDDKCIKFLRELKKEDEKKLKVGSDAVAGVGGGVGGAAVAGGTGAMIGLYYTVGLTTAALATTATVVTGGAVVAVAGLAIAVPLLIKLARKRRSKKKD